MRHSISGPGSNSNHPSQAVLRYRQWNLPERKGGMGSREYWLHATMMHQIDLQIQVHVKLAARTSMSMGCSSPPPPPPPPRGPPTPKRLPRLGEVPQTSFAVLWIHGLLQCDDVTSSLWSMKYWRRTNSRVRSADEYRFSPGTKVLRGAMWFWR